MVSSTQEPPAFDTIDDARATRGHLLGNVAVGVATMIVVIVVGVYTLAAGALFVLWRKAAH